MTTDLKVFKYAKAHLSKVKFFLASPIFEQYLCGSRRVDSKVRFYKDRCQLNFSPPPRYGPPTRTDYRLIVENLSSRVSWQVRRQFCVYHVLELEGLLFSYLKQELVCSNRVAFVQLQLPIEKVKASRRIFDGWVCINVYGFVCCVDVILTRWNRLLFQRLRAPIEMRHRVNEPIQSRDDLSVAPRLPMFERVVRR